MATRQKNTKRLWTGLLLIVVAVFASLWLINNRSAEREQETVESISPTIGTVVEKALAIGTIQPLNEIEVKSKISGVVNILMVQSGDYVQRGDPLLEVRPDPTPLELAEAKRNLERINIEKENVARELARVETLRNRNLASQQQYEQYMLQYNDVLIREQMGQERLELLESGRIQIGDTLIESVIYAPIDGYILETTVDEGDPVVPLTSYQAGTALMTIAAMEHLLFKGTVDEIDVGKLTEGMSANIKIGALPDVLITGEVTRISLKAQQVDNATVFPVEIRITDSGDTVLRAGYSANAEIIIEQATDVLTIPERVVYLREGKAYVDVPGSEPDSRLEKEIQLGLSDAITVEVVSGLDEDDRVLEHPLRTLTVR